MGLNSKTDMRDFPNIKEMVDEAFPTSPPARCSIAVAEIPRLAKVAVEAVAALGDA